MADKKISELTAITGADTAADDYFIVVDTSGSATKKISRAELNNAIEQDVLENISITNLTSDLNTNGNDILFGDNDKAIFGAGSDLQIYHDGSNSFVNDTGTGNLVLRGANVAIQDASANNQIFVNNGGAVDLRYAGSAKLATTSGGIDVTGTVTADGLDTTSITSASNVIVDIDNDNNTTGAVFDIKADSASRLVARFIENGDISFYDNTGVTQGFFWDASTQRLGLGTTSPSAPIHLKTTGSAELRLEQDGAGYGTIKSSDFGILYLDADAGNTVASSSMRFRVDGSEAMRIDASGNVIIGKTAANATAAGAYIAPDGDAFLVRDGQRPLVLNRLTSDGNIAEFRKDGSTVGLIGADAGDLVIGTGIAGLRFLDSSSAVIPRNSDGTQQDNVLDFGSTNHRWVDIYATNATIQTSDANEKQDIEELTDAEQRVAVAAKGLLRKYRWKSSVEEKGDDARIHFGIIAQDLKAAFEAEGLDAGRYAMFINTEWTDEETGEQKSRMGIRYNQLLAFIIAAI